MQLKKLKNMLTSDILQPSCGLNFFFYFWSKFLVRNSCTSIQPVNKDGLFLQKTFGICAFYRSLLPQGVNPELKTHRMDAGKICDVTLRYVLTHKLLV